MGHTITMAAIGAVTFMVLYGAVFGVVVYGVYDFTNYSTLRQWPFVLALVDVAWGGVASAACAAAVWSATR